MLVLNFYGILSFPGRLTLYSMHTFVIGTERTRQFVRLRSLNKGKFYFFLVRTSRSH